MNAQLTTAFWDLAFRCRRVDLNFAGPTLYLTGGSTGFDPLVAQISARFPAAKLMRGDPFGSVALGLGLHARRLFGTPGH
jgi:hypothetical protein